MKKRHFTGLSLLTTALVILASVLLFAHSAKADSFNANNLIDDATFANNNSMSATQINNFLNAQPASCISPNPNGNGNPGFTTPDPLGWNGSSYSFGGNVSAGKAIYDIAQIYHVNPEVILTTLQKEQSVVTGSAGCYYNAPNPSSATPMTNACGGGTQNCTIACPYSGGCMNIAMSYACPNYCKASDEGFSLQLTLGTWLLRFAEERAYGIISGYAGQDPGDENIHYSGPMTAGYRQQYAGGPSIYWDGSYTTEDGTSVTIDNGSTAALYYYTPFISGNVSFTNIYNKWFGSTHSNIAILQSSNGNLYLQENATIRYIPSMDIYNDWGFESMPISTPGDSYINSLQLVQPQLGDAGQISGTSGVYFFQGGRFYYVPSQAAMTAWQINSNNISDVTQSSFEFAIPSGTIGYSVKSASSSTVYMLDASTIHAYPSVTLWQAWDGMNANAITLDTNLFNSLTVGSSVSSNVATYNGNEYLIDNQGQYSISPTFANLYPSTSMSLSSVTFNRLLNYGTAGFFVKSSSSSPIYLLDSGSLHQIGNQNLLNNFSGGNPLIINLTPSGLSLFSTGNSINNSFVDVSGQLYLMDAGNSLLVPSGLDSAYRAFATPYSASSALINIYPSGQTTTGFIKTDVSPTIYLIDNGQIRPISTLTDFQLLDGSRNEAVTVITNTTLSQLDVGQPITSYVTNGTTNYAFDNGTYYSVNATAASDWDLSNPSSIDNATLSRFTAAGTPLQGSAQTNGTYYEATGNIYSTSSSALANIWDLNSATSMSATFTSRLSSNPLSHLIKSTDPSNPNVYVMDNGTLHLLSDPNMMLNFGYVPGSSPFVYLSPTTLGSFTVADTASYVVESGSNYYIMDGGSVRQVPNCTVLANWVNNGCSATVTNISSQLLNYFPTQANITQVIKSSGPNLYYMNNGQAQLISSIQTYQQSYSTYEITTVSNSLLSEIPKGPVL